MSEPGPWETLRLERDGHVGRLTLNRPERLNAFTMRMWQELAALGAALSSDPADLRALVVTGAGRAFSSGIDTAVFTDGSFAAATSTGAGGDGDGGVGGDLVSLIQRTQDAYSWLEEAPFVTIAAVRGYALGAGLQLALACDLRVLAEGTQVGLLELRYGMMPDLGGTQRLPRLVGPGKAKELILLGERIDAAEALRIGLCERVVPDADLDAEASALAARIAAQPPLAVRGVKAAVGAAGDLPRRQGLRVEAEGQAACLTSDDLREAITAFAEQRAPVYRGR
jgi:enoyl-CoA hydratase/carnithine racemase